MRLLFLFLLLVNGAIYLWYTLQVDAAPQTAKRSQLSPRLMLLTEHDQPPQPIQTQSAKTESLDAVADEAAEPVEERFCFTLGPFMDEKAVGQVEQQLATQNHHYVRRASEHKEQIGYWVFLPPLGDLEQAREKAEELKLLGDKHFYVVKTPEEYANAISLGVFRDKANAERRHKQVKKMGYEPRIEGRFRQNPVYWLDYEQTDTETELVSDSLVGVKNLPRACEAVAAAVPLP